MKSTLKSLLLATTTATLMTSTAAMAYEAGDILVKGGLAIVSPDDKTTATTFGAGTGASVDSNGQLGLTLTYMYTDNIGVELLAATPFNHNISGTGGLGGNAKIADTKHLPPTLTINYYPMDSNSPIQPYIGAGVNYTHFFDEQTAGAIAGTNIDLDNSWGLAAHAGVDYELDENWSLNASVWYIDIETTATVTTTAGAFVGSLDVEIDPMVYMVGVSYKF